MHRKVGVKWVSIMMTSVVLCLWFHGSSYTGGNIALPMGKVECYIGVPCVYPDTADLRIIIMTYSRAASLIKLLKSLDKLELDGDAASIEIWIDRNKDTNSVDNQTLEVAQQFEWSRGQKRVHVHKRHVGLYGQWIDTWRPKPDTKEMALILEDDLSVSPFAYRWLKAVHVKYGSREDVAGYTLQSEGINKANGGGAIQVPQKDAAYMYKLVGSWGYAPHPRSWRQFQDWYHEKIQDKTFHPYVTKASMMNGWYKAFEKKGTSQNMWTMWHLCYAENFKKFSVYNNIAKKERTPKNRHYLCSNRKEAGLHYGKKQGQNEVDKLLMEWHQEFVDLPDTPVKYDWDGKTIK